LVQIGQVCEVGEDAGGATISFDGESIAWLNLDRFGL
jgi:hypothetical protein